MKLTDGGEDARKTEVVHGVQGKQVEQKLLPFFFTEKERMRFVQLSVSRGHKEKKICQEKKGFVSIC